MVDFSIDIIEHSRNNTKFEPNTIFNNNNPNETNKNNNNNNNNNKIMTFTPNALYSDKKTYTDEQMTLMAITSHIEAGFTQLYDEIHKRDKES
jgi:hypothetical protein